MGRRFFINDWLRLSDCALVSNRDFYVCHFWPLLSVLDWQWLDGSRSCATLSSNTVTRHLAPRVNRHIWLWLPVELRVHRFIEIVGLQLDSLEERIQQDKSLAIVLDP